MIKSIRKRDGQLVEFDKKKITEAIFAATLVAGGSVCRRSSGCGRRGLN